MTSAAAAAAAAAGNNASVYFESIDVSLIPILTLQSGILESLGGSPLPISRALECDLRALAADFQVPLREMLLLEMTRDRASIGEHCEKLDGTLRSLTTHSLELKSALFRYEAPVQDDTSLDRMYKFNEQLAADFERFRDLASKVCPWTDPLELAEREFGWWLQFNSYLAAVTNVWALLNILYAIFFSPPKLFKKVKNWWYGAGKEVESKNKTKAAVATSPPPPPPPAAAPAASTAPAVPAAPAPAPAAPAPAPSKGGKKKRRRNTESARS